MYKMSCKFGFACFLLYCWSSFFTAQACLDQLKVIWGYKGEVFGPISGGTLILLYSPNGGLDDLYAHGALLVLESGSHRKQCELSEEVPRNDTFRAHLSPMGEDSYIQKEFKIKLLCPSTGDYFDLDKNFAYKPDPTVDRDATDLKTIVSGGIELIFRGTNLMSVGFPVMMMYLQYYDGGREQQRGCYDHDQSIWCKQICRLRNDTEFYCVSPDMYTILPPHLNGGYAGGGQGASYGGWQTTFSTAPGLEINRDSLEDTNEISVYMSFILSMNIVYDDETGNGRRKRQATGVFVDPAVLDVDASVGLLLDGERTGVTKSTSDDTIPLKIAQDPEFNTFDVKEYNPEFHKNEDTLKITAKYMDSGADQWDFYVTIGGAECPLIGPPANNAIICKPPEEPDDPKGPTKDGGLQVVVRVGYLPVSIGFLKYVRWYQSSVFIGIVVTVISVPLFLVAVYFLITKWALQRFYPKEYPFVVPSVHSNFYDQNVLTKIGADLLRRVRESGLLLPESAKVRVVDRIGSGNFGVVYEGFLQGDDGEYEQHVAVKTLKEYRSLDDEQVKGVFEEALIMSQFNHPNIVNIIGIAILRNQPHIIMPLLRKKDLRSHLRNRNNRFTVKELVEFGVQIASGMAHMESKGVVHRDLAARNCMVSDNDVIKVSDFGLARETNYRDYYQQQKKGGGLPVRWMAPETFTTYRFTSKSDVWSFGVVLWEILSRGGHPYADYADGEILQRLNIDIRLPQPPMCPTEIYNIMKKCWASEPEHRPSFAQVVVMMREIINSQQSHYVDPSVYVEYERVPAYDDTRGDYSSGYSYLYMVPVQPNGKAVRGSMPPEQAPVPPQINSQYNAKYHP